MLLPGLAVRCHVEIGTPTSELLSKARYRILSQKANSRIILAKFEMAKWEARCFDKLGNDIMLQLAAEVDPWEPKDISALGRDTKAARDERMRALKQTMRAGTSSGSYGDYPWDRVSITSKSKK